MERAELLPLDRDQCIEAASGEKVGRLSVVVDDFPCIYPLNFVIDDEHGVVFRVEAGSTIDTVTPSNACFEVDGIDSQLHVGWSVRAKGRLHDITDAIGEYAEHLRALEVSPWSAGERAVWLALWPQEWTGRTLKR